MVRARTRGQTIMKKPNILSRGSREGQYLLNTQEGDDCSSKPHLCHSSPTQSAITKYFCSVPAGAPPTPPSSSTGSETETVSPHHKIQMLEADVVPALALSPSGALSRLTLSPSKKLLLSPKANGTVKSRRRLNPCQSQNQQKPEPKDVPADVPVPVPTCQPKPVAAPVKDKLTDYFPVRRSGRRPKRTLQEEHHRSIEQAIMSGCEDGLEVHHFPGKGRGVVASRSFERGEFVVEYSGELIDVSEARLREQRYANDQNTGCYMYYFKYRNLQYCIDATAETTRLGRLVNHSRQGNLQTRTVLVKNQPHLVLVARTNIEIGEEVLYDYGDRSKESLLHHPWLAM